MGPPDSKGLIHFWRWFFLASIFLFGFCSRCFSSSVLIELNDNELACLEKTVYLNECAAKKENLIIWPHDEDFPSLGIGHFIWYPEGRRGPYKETFPELLLFMRLRGQAIPEWLTASGNLPWHDRESFLQDTDSDRVRGLRDFLFRTRDIQTEFIVQRFHQSLPYLLSALPAGEEPNIRGRLQRVLNAPNGLIAVIDYVNFKGEGLLEEERFRGQGWGLLQVLQQMNDVEKGGDILEEFVRAAETVLDRRVANAPEGAKEKDRIRGWKFRVQRYLTPGC